MGAAHRFRSRAHGQAPPAAKWEDVRGANENRNGRFPGSVTRVEFCMSLVIIFQLINLNFLSKLMKCTCVRVPVKGQ